VATVRTDAVSAAAPLVDERTVLGGVVWVRRYRTDEVRDNVFVVPDLHHAF
jgi:hypothetical protein